MVAGSGPAPAIPAAPHDAAARRTRIALWVSFAVILVYWAVFAARQLLATDGHPVPASVAELALRVVLRATIVFIVTWSLLRAAGGRPANLGVTLANWPHSLIVGGTAAILVFAVVTFGLNPLAGMIVGGGGDQALRPLFRDPREAPYWVVSAIVGGGFAEELERAFVLTRFEKLFGRRGLVAGFVLSSVVFGLGHLYQGPASALSIGLTGALMGMVFLRRRRAIEAMVAHAGFDLISITLAYALYAS